MPQWNREIRPQKVNQWHRRTKILTSKMNQNFDFDLENRSRMSKKKDGSKYHIKDIKGYIDAIIRLPLLMRIKEEWFDTRDKEDERYDLEEKKGWV